MPPVCFFGATRRLIMALATVAAFSAFGQSGFVAPADEQFERGR